MTDINVDTISTPTHPNAKMEKMILSFKFDTVQNADKVFSKLKRKLTPETLATLQEHLSARVDSLNESLKKHGDHQPYRMIAAIENITALKDKVDIITPADLKAKRRLRIS